MPFATDHPSRAVAPDPNPAEKRAAALRALLARKGGTPVRTQFGQFNYRGSGYGSAVLGIAVEAGWLVEARRTPAARFDAEHDRVEYRYVELASAADVASPVARESKPETKRRTQRPTRKASTRQASTRSKSSLPTEPQPLADGTPCLSRADAAVRWGTTHWALTKAVSNDRVDVGAPYRAPGAPGAPSVPIALTPKTERYAARTWLKPPTPSRRSTLPTSPPPTEDGHECVTIAAAVERFETTESALRNALHHGRIERGPKYLPEGATGRGQISVALSPRTLAYAKRVWAPKAAPRVAELVDGSEILSRHLWRALGYVGRPHRDQITRLDAVPNRYVHPTNHRQGRLYRVGRELVEVARALGVEVRLVATPRPDAEPRPASPPASVASWTDLLDLTPEVATPVFA